MTENAKKWLELVSTDPELQQKTKELQTETIDQQKVKVTELAQAHGITLTEEDFAVPQDGELSDDELDAVAGGGGCGCPVIGGGAGSDERTETHYGCACIVGGGGRIEKCMNGDDVSGANCICQIIGGGTDVGTYGK